MYSAWKAVAIGRSSKTVREFLEKNWAEDLDKEATIKLAVKSLLEVVQTGAKSETIGSAFIRVNVALCAHYVSMLLHALSADIEIAVMEGFGKVRVSPAPQLSALLRVNEISRSRNPCSAQLFTPRRRIWSCRKSKR